MQNRPPAATGTNRTEWSGSAAEAQIKAINQPISVHPRKRFSRKMPLASRLSLPMIAGRKYRKIMQIRASTVHPFHIGLGTATSPPASIQHYANCGKRFRRPGLSRDSTTSYYPAPCTFTSSSANFCLRSSWSLPPSFSASCVMFMEQNFGPHMEQNFASL